MTRILVTGATGTIGRAVVPMLLADPAIAVRAATRNPSPAVTARVEQVRFDWDAPFITDRLVSEVDSVLIIPPTGRHPLPTTERLLEVAARYDIAHVVLLSTFGADLEPGFAFGRWALQAELVVAESGLSHTILRPNSYMSNFLGMFKPTDDGSLQLPWGDGRTSFIDTDDVVAVAGRVLQRPGPWRGAILELTGPEALDGDEIAEALAAATGDPVNHVSVCLDALSDSLRRSGLTSEAVAALVELHQVMARGERAAVTADVQRVLERAPRTLQQFAADHASGSRVAIRVGSSPSRCWPEGTRR
jgi:uncharacterized protein YbjT (DUF2867 family)